MRMTWMLAGKILYIPLCFCLLLLMFAIRCCSIALCLSCVPDEMADSSRILCTAALINRQYEFTGRYR